MEDSKFRWHYCNNLENLLSNELRSSHASWRRMLLTYQLCVIELEIESHYEHTDSDDLGTGGWQFRSVEPKQKTAKPARPRGS